MTGTVLSRRETLQPRHIVEVSAAQQRHLTTGDQNDLTQKLSRIHMADAPQVTSPQLHKTTRLHQFVFTLPLCRISRTTKTFKLRSSLTRDRSTSRTDQRQNEVCFSPNFHLCSYFRCYFQNSSLSVSIFSYMLQFFTAKMFQKSIDNI